MKFFKTMKDGGPESTVWGFFLAEIKSLFTIVLLHFHPGSREAYHSHAFNALSWVLKGKLTEYVRDGKLQLVQIVDYKPSLRPIWTPRDRLHKVVSTGDTYVLSFRGQWAQTWGEYLPFQNKYVTLTHGRKTV